MSGRRGPLAALAPLLAAAVLLLLAACAAGPSRDAVTIVVVGDTQRTSLGEILLGREQNDAERARVVAGVAAEGAGLCVHLGDMVFDGGDELEWRRFDELWTPVTRRGTEVVPVLGNHEYWGGQERGPDAVAARFAAARQGRWYARRAGALALVVLDSNEAVLGPGRWEEERRWYEAELARLERDPRVRGVLVFAHHPPFTDSTVTGDDAAVQRAFVPAFAAATKTLAMICGHTHAYERFAVDGKCYLVAGGGGGPRVALAEGAAARHRDLFEGPSPRPFHWLVLREVAGGVEVVVRGFDKGEAGLRALERFVLPY